MIYKHLFCSGKNPKLPYFLKNCFLLFIPRKLFQLRLYNQLSRIISQSDIQYVLNRVNYYNHLEQITSLPPLSTTLAEHRFKNKKGASVYFFDTYKYTKWFKNSLTWQHIPGDITLIPPFPSIVKSRPINTNNQNAILLNLNKIRHFIFVHDAIDYEDKKDIILFRGKIYHKPQRIEFLEKYFLHPLCDIGAILERKNTKWIKEKLSLYQQLHYKFIMAIEGNDVASNLKWIMSSNSIAVMPRPKYETWFMEGHLIPNYHYIEIKADFSDLEERITYYLSHPEKAKEIIKNANNYIKQFQNKKREKLISLLVLDKYFYFTNPTLYESPLSYLWK